jgi:spore coat polysaccharide biosynthesis protein SpsF
VDTEEDFELVGRILRSLYPQNPHFTLEDALKLLGEHPEWSAINEEIRQKEV